MTKLLCFFLLFSPAVTSAQIKFTGKISDAETGEPLPYATIGFPQKSVGVMANAAGEFVLAVPGELSHDTLVVSFVGYKSLKVSLTGVEGKLHVKLQPAAVEIPEVVVEAQAGRVSYEKTIGINKGKTFMSTAINQHYLSAFYEVDSSVSYKLEKMRIYVSSWPNKESQLRVRIQLPDTASRNIPGEEIHYKDIIIQPKKDRKWIEADLIDYNLFVREPGFFVTLELLSAGMTADINPAAHYTIGTVPNAEGPEEIKVILAKQHLFGNWMYSQGGFPMIGFDVSVYEKGK